MVYTSICQVYTSIYWYIHLIIPRYRFSRRTSWCRYAGCIPASCRTRARGGRSLSMPRGWRVFCQAWSGWYGRGDRQVFGWKCSVDQSSTPGKSTPICTRECKRLYRMVASSASTCGRDPPMGPSATQTKRFHGFNPKVCNYSWNVDVYVCIY